VRRRPPELQQRHPARTDESRKEGSADSPAHRQGSTPNTHMTDDVRTFTIEALRGMNYDVSEVTDDTELGPAGLDLESLALADLAVQLEDHYQVKFNDDDMESLALMTLAEFTSALHERITAAGGAPAVALAVALAADSAV
jgi:acyl carrier protein